MIKKENYNLSEPFNYENDLEFSKNDPISFWDQVGKKYVKWDKMYEKVYSGDEKNPNWYDGGELNISYNALDVHINNPEKRDQIAMIHECPLLNLTYKLTYFELWNKVCIFSRALKNLGIKKGDGVMIYMPTTIEASIAILSCARLGAIHCCVFAGLSASNLAIRIDHFKPKLLITSNYGIKGNETIELSSIVLKSIKESNHKLENIIIKNRNGIEFKSTIDIPNSLDWDEIVNGIEPLLEYTIVESSHPILLIYTSGTTGTPKGINILTGGLMVVINYVIRSQFNIKQDHVFFSTSDIGWLVGQSYNTYGFLTLGTTSIIYEGDPIIPNPNNFYKIIEKHRVNTLISIPTEIKLFQNQDPNADSIKHLDLTCLDSIYFLGERLDNTITDFITYKFKTKVCDYYGQTESMVGFVTSGKATPGYNCFILSDKNEVLKPNETGELVIKLPLPPGFINTLYLNQLEYDKKYLNRYPGYFRTGDIAYKDNDDNIHIVSRVDDVINVCGEKVNCGICEEIILKHPSIIDCVVIGIKDNEYVERVIALVILKSDTPSSPSLLILNELNKQLESDIHEYARLKYLIPVTSIPTTRSGKKLRNTLSNIFNVQEHQIPPTIKDINVLNQIEHEINQFKLQQKI